jgi:hypothetical protein
MTGCAFITWRRTLIHRVLIQTFYAIANQILVQIGCQLSLAFRSFPLCFTRGGFHQLIARRRILADFGAFVMHTCYAFRLWPALTMNTDGGGFEPPVPFGTHAFQACTINRSVTHPG